MTGANEVIGANVANGIIFTIDTIVANETIGVIVNIATIVWPMYHHCLQWIVIVAICANVSTVAIGHHSRCQQLLLDILTFTWPRHGANGAI